MSRQISIVEVYNSDISRKFITQPVLVYCPICEEAVEMKDTIHILQSRRTLGDEIYERWQGKCITCGFGVYKVVDFNKAKQVP